MEDFSNTEELNTYQNPKGIIAVSGSKSSTVLAYLGLCKGQVIIKKYSDPKEKSISIEAHESDIGCIGINFEGSLIATCSDKGTLIRVFRTDDGTAIQEVRRGKNIAEIYCLSFSADYKLLACSSDTGTIHIFSLNVMEKENSIEEGNPKNKTSL